MANIQEPTDTSVTAPEHATFNAHWSPKSPNRLFAQPGPQRHAWERQPRRTNAKNKTRTIWKRYELRKPEPQPLPSESDEPKDTNPATPAKEAVTPVGKILKKLRTRKDDTGLTPRTKRTMGVTAVAKKRDSLLRHKLPTTLQDISKPTFSESHNQALDTMNVSRAHGSTPEAEPRSHLMDAAAGSHSPLSEQPTDEAEHGSAIKGQTVAEEAVISHKSLLLQEDHHASDSGPGLKPTRRSRRRHTEHVFVVQNDRGRKSNRLSLPSEQVDRQDAPTVLALDHLLPPCDSMDVALESPENSQVSISVIDEQHQILAQPPAMNSRTLTHIELRPGARRKAIHARISPEKRPTAGRRRISDVGAQVNTPLQPIPSVTNIVPTNASRESTQEDGQVPPRDPPRKRGRPARRRTWMSETLITAPNSRKRRATTALDILEAAEFDGSRPMDPVEMPALADEASMSSRQDPVTQTTAVLRSSRRRQTDFVPGPPEVVPISRKRRASTALDTLKAPELATVIEVTPDEAQNNRVPEAVVETTKHKREPRWSTTTKGRRKTDGSCETPEPLGMTITRRASTALDSLEESEMPDTGSQDVGSTEEFFLETDAVVAGPAVGEHAIDQPAVDEAAVDEAAVDEPTVDEATVDELVPDKPAIIAPSRRPVEKSRRISRRRTGVTSTRVSRSASARTRRASIAAIDTHEGSNGDTIDPSGTHDQMDATDGIDDANSTGTINGQGEGPLVSQNKVDTNARQTLPDDEASQMGSPRTLASEADLNASSSSQSSPSLVASKKTCTLREEDDCGDSADMLADVLFQRHDTAFDALTADSEAGVMKTLTSLVARHSPASTAIESSSEQFLVLPDAIEVDQTIVEDEQVETTNEEIVNSVASEQDHGTAIKIQLNDEDTDMLKDFLSRSKANKAAKIAEKASDDSRRDSDIVKAALASPRQPLEALDINLASPRKDANGSLEIPLHMPSPGVLDSSPTQIPAPEGLALNDGLGEEDELTSTEVQAEAEAEADAELQDDDTTSSTSRRSGRASRTSRATPNSISIRRQGGDAECVALRKSEAQQLALLTRSNTRRNKGGSVHARVMLLRLKPGAAGESLEGDSPSAASPDILGKVRWNETLCAFSDESKTEHLVSADTNTLQRDEEAETTRPRARRSRMLGAANGTPAKPRLKDIDASVSVAPISIALAPVPAAAASNSNSTSTSSSKSKRKASATEGPDTASASSSAIAPSTAASMSNVPAAPAFTPHAPAVSAPDTAEKLTAKATSTHLPKPTKKTTRGIPTPMPAKRKAAPSLLAAASTTLAAAAAPQLPQPAALQLKPTPMPTPMTLGLAARSSRRQVQVVDKENRDPATAALSVSVTGAKAGVTELPRRSVLPRRGGGAGAGVRK